MAGLSAGPDTFFCVSPAEPGKAQCFAVKRGDVSGRAEVVFHQPWIRDHLALLEQSSFAIKSLGSLTSDIRYGAGSPPPYLDASEKTVPFVRATDIKDGEVNTETLLHVANEQPRRMDKCRLQSGELIIVRSGVNTGDCAVIPESLANSFAAYDLILTFGPDASAQFVGTFLDTEIGRLQLNVVKGRSAQPHINAKEIAALQIPLPSMAEQEKLIAAMETLRAERKTKLAQAKALLAGLDSFVLDSLGLVPPLQELRPVFAVKYQAVQQRLDSHFHSPEFAQIQKMLSQTKCEPLGHIITLAKEMWRPEDHEQSTFRYIEISSVDPKTGEAQWNTVPTEEAPSRARMRVREDDLIVSLTRPHHGSIAHLGPEFEGCIASTGFAVIRDVASHVDRDYLWCVLRSRICLSQMLQRASGGNYPAITEAELRNITVPVPSESIQRLVATEAVRRLEEARHLRAEAEKTWREAKQWFEAQLLGFTTS